MIAASLKDSEGDPIIDLLLRKGADVNMKSNSGQVSLRLCFKIEFFAGRSRTNPVAKWNRMPSTSQHPKTTYRPSANSYPRDAVLGCGIAADNCRCTAPQLLVLSPY